MVRETRHLWIGNLPENVREEQIRDLFQRHGRVQSVKLVSDESSSTIPNNATNLNNNGLRGKTATVSFIDIRSAAKALRGSYTLAGQPLSIKYYEPNAVVPPTREGCGILAEHENSSPGGVGEPNTAAIGSESGNVQPTTTPVAHGPPNSSNVNSSSNGPMSGSSGNNIGGGPYRHQQRFPVQHGQSEESSHFYDQPKNFNRGRGGDGNFHHRGRRDHRNSYHNRHQFQTDRNYNNRMSNSNSWNYQNENRFAPPVHPEPEERTSGPPPVSHNSSNETGNKVPRRPESPAGSVSSRHLSRHKSRSVSESGSSERGSSAGSRSRSGSRSSVSTSVSSGHSRSPARRGAVGHFSRGGSIGSNSSGRFPRNSYSRQRYSRSQLVSRPADSSRVHHSSRSSPLGASPSSSSSSSSSPHRKIVPNNTHSPSRSPSSTKSYSPSRTTNTTGQHHHSSSSSHHRHPPNSTELACAIRIRNLPIRSSDTSLKDGLFHEYKKHGKVSWVRLTGCGAARYAVVCFKSADQAARAVTVSQDKQFFGCKIQVAPYFEGGSSRLNGGGEEIINRADEENRLLNEDDSPTATVAYPHPSRSILFNGLDSAITVQELRQAFEQYGDIAAIDIRKVGGNNQVVCEFVDIASAIRAQWGRYVFKSRDSRISFFKNPPSSSLLLDGTANVTEKQVHSYCCQYGAIKKVIMDPARILAIVQFETISSAQTAIRELRSWIINRKHLHVDFASPICTGMFIERLQLKSLPNDLEGSSGGISSPHRVRSLSPTNIADIEPGTRVHRGSRKFVDDSALNRKMHRRKDIDMEDGTLHKYVDELGSSENSNHSSYSNRTVEFGGHTLENQINSGYNRNVRSFYHSNRHSRGEVRTSPVSPEIEGGEPDAKNEKFNIASGSKIDLSCHETDSAIVTSSSDVICSEKEASDVPVTREFHQNHRGSSSRCLMEDPELIVNDAGTGLISRKLIAWNKPNVIVTVDGVSSTSPEPKTETVRKVSPDPGIGNGPVLVESISKTSDSSHLSNGPTDPRKQAIDDLRRRASADSAHQETLVVTPARIVRTSSSVDNVIHNSSVESPTPDDPDDRPGTPLCDENPESFTSSDTTFLANKTRPPTTQLPTSRPKITKHEEPLSLPLPEFAHHKQTNVLTSSSVISRLGKNLSEPNLSSKNLAGSPKKLKNVSDVVVSKLPSVPTSEKLSSDTSSTNTNISVVASNDFLQKTVLAESEPLKEIEKDRIIISGENSRISDESVLIVDEIHNVSASPASVLIDDDVHNEDIDNDDINSLSSSDSEGRSSRNSPTATQLEQRIQKLYEKYDQWSGSRTAVKSSTVPNSSLNFSLSSDNSAPGGKSSEPGQPETDQSTTSSLSASLLNKPWYSRSKPWSLDEMKHEPSDIVKSLLAKKSVFDEDSKRLENFEEKYDAKTLASSTINSTNWRQALNRSASTPTNASVLSTPVFSTASPVKTSNVFATTSANSQLPHSISSRPLNSITSSSSVSFGAASKVVNAVSSPSTLLLKRRESVSVHGESPKLDSASFNKVNLKFGSIPSPISDPSTPGKNPTSTIHHRPHSYSVSELPKSATIRPSSTIKSKYASLVETSTKTAGSPTRSLVPDKEISTPKPVGINQPNTPLSNKYVSTTLGQVQAQPTHATQLPPPQVGIHQGIPRMVERSTSLDSKRHLAGGVAGPNTPQTIPTSGNLNAGNVICGSISASSSRRPSIDLHQSQTHIQPTSAQNVKEAPLVQSKANIMNDNMNIKSSHHIPKLDTKEITITHPKELSSKPTPSLTILPHKDNLEPKTFRYDNIVKVDPGYISQLHEPTVAVVATVQTPVLQSQKSSGNNSGNPDKDKSNGNSNSSGKRDSKDPFLNNAKKNNASGSGSSVNNNNNVKPAVSSSSKLPKEKSTTKSNKPDSEVNNHQNGAKKKDKVVDGSSGSGSALPREHKKDRGNNKIRRSHSSQEKEQDVKKMKLEKDKEPSSETKEPTVESQNHNVHKHVNSFTDRRESVDTSSKSKPPKDKDKPNSSEQVHPNKVVLSEKTEATLSIAPSQPAKSDKPDKDHHHHKTKSLSLGSSSTSGSKHHHSTSSDKTNLNSHSSHKHKDKKESTSTSSNKDKERISSTSKSSSDKTSSSKHPTTDGSGHKHLNHHKKDKESTSTLSSSSKSKPKEHREKEKPKISTTSSSFITSLDSDCAPENGESVFVRTHVKKDKDKAEIKSKGERHKSGGESSSAAGTSSSKSKMKQQKKRRRIVVDDSDSSNDSDEQKHHSIFEVVIDEYVSMYDKVKARSNRACKNTMTPQQQKEEQSKQDKLQESFQQLKKCRAKREEKKRSTSVDDRKSDMNTSTDDNSHHTDDASDHESRKSGFSKGKPKSLKGMNSSDDDGIEVHRSLKPNKHSSSSRASPKHVSGSKSAKRPKKHESSPHGSTPYFLSNSDQGSEGEPSLKRQKLGSKHQNPNMTVKDSDSKSSDSDSDVEKSKSIKPSSLGFIKNKHLQKKMSIEIYPESDNSSVKSNKPKKMSTSSMQASASGKPRKEKTSKQKSIDAMKKSLFDYSDSSDESSKISSFSPKKDKISSKVSSGNIKNKDDKENKSNHKKSSLSLSPHGHKTVTVLTSTSSTSKKIKNKRKSQDPSKAVLSRRESVLATEADLFGSMSSSNESDSASKKTSPVVKTERPITPPVVSSSNILDEVQPLPRKSKHGDRSKQKKHSTSSQKVDPENIDAENLGSVTSSRQRGKSSSSTEKRKRRHHKRSRREGSGEKSAEKPSVKQEPFVDYASLFNSPPSSSTAGPDNSDTFKSEQLFAGLTPSTSSSSKLSPTIRLKENDVIEEGMKSMFSTDEDEDEDNNLKIGITEAIKVSENEKLTQSPTDNSLELLMKKELDEKEAAAAAVRLEEEIKRNCLFEQDKAIESILMERKSPANSSGDLTTIQTQSGVNDGDENNKDDFTKNEAAISQEETEDAVAALLGTLGGEGDDDEAEENTQEKSSGSHSPPTLRIIEESSPSVPAAIERSVSPTNVASPWYAKSPLELQIDEGVVGKEPEVCGLSPPAQILPKTPEEKFDILKKFTQEFGEVESVPDKILAEVQKRRNSRLGSNEAGRLGCGDIYEFHDSDDEKTRRAKAVGAAASVHIIQKDGSITPPAKSPLASLSGILEHEKPAIADTLPKDHDQLPLQVLIPIAEEKPMFEFSAPVVVSSVSPVGKILSQATPPTLAQPLAPAATPTTSARTSVDDTIDHVIRMANFEASINPFIPTKPTPMPRGRSRSKSKDTSDDQSSTIAAIINRVARSGSPKQIPATEASAPFTAEPPVIQLQKPTVSGQPLIPGLDTRSDSAVRIPAQKGGREMETLIDPKTGLLQPMVRQSDEGQYAPIPGKQDSDKHFLQQQLYAYKMQPAHLQQQFVDKAQAQAQMTQQQFLHKTEGLANVMLAQAQQQQMMDHQHEQQKQFQQHRAELAQHPANKPPLLSPPAQPKTAIIYTTSEPFIPTKFSTGPGSNVDPSNPANNGSSMPMSRPGFYAAPNICQMNAIKPHEMMGAGPRGFPEMRPQHPNIPTLAAIQQQGQIQAQLVRIPQVPSATTITKVDSRGEQEQAIRSGNVMQQHPSVIFTSAAQGPVIRTSVMPGHQVVQNRPNDKFGNQNSPRVEINGNLVQPCLGSPKAGRVPQQYESNQPQAGQHRVLSSQHHPYEPQMDTSSPVPLLPLDLVTQSSNQNKDSNALYNNNNNKLSTTNISSSPSTPYLQQQPRQADVRALQMQRPPQGSSPFMQAQQQHGYYVPVSVAVNLPSGASLPSPTGYGMRPGSSDSGKMQMDGPPKGSLLQERPPHLIPPHISSPASDRGSAESPRLIPVYPQRQFFSSTPSHLSISHSPSVPTVAHQHSRQTFLHPFADMDEAPFPHGTTFYQTANLVREREGEMAREDSDSFSSSSSVAGNIRRCVSSPPPAHNIRYSGVHAAEAPGSNERQIQVQTPPHGSQVPPHGDSLLMLLQRYPIMWQGLLALKNDNAACQMHFVSGNMSVARDSLPTLPDGSIPPLRISQRMRLEQAQLDGVARKLQLEAEHCMLLALPCGRDHMDVLQQSNNLRTGFITYLQLKQAAGIVNIHHPQNQMPAYVIHIFPSCDFANENLARIAPDLLHGVADIAHLLIVIATV